MAKYRIKEFRGEFTIEIEVPQTKGFLWWKKEVYVWRRTNIWGGAFTDFPIQQPVKYFNSLNDAQLQIQLWKDISISHPIYHEPK